MNIEKLEKLPTKRLLAYYKAERKRRSMPSYDPDADENYNDVHLSDIKQLLDDREHIKKK